MSTKGNEAAPSSAVAKPYEPTCREQEAIEAHFRRRRKRSPAPRLKVMVGDVSEIAVDHPEPSLGQALLMEAIGTAEPDFLDGLLGQLANAGTTGRVVDERGLNFMLAWSKAWSRVISWKPCSRLRWRRSTTRP